MDFRPLSGDERKQLEDALKANSEDGHAILMNPRDTTFIGASESHEDEMIAAIKSVPCHYVPA